MAACEVGELVKIWSVALAPILAAIVTAGALIFQAALTARKEQRRMEADRAERQAQRDDDRNSAKDEIIDKAREEWATSFHVYLTHLLRWVKRLPLKASVDLLKIATEEFQAAQERLHVAIARVLLVEPDERLRPLFHALTLAAAVPEFTDGDPRRLQSFVKEQREHLGRVYSAFFKFLETVSNAAFSRDAARLVLEAVRSSGLPEEIENDVISRIREDASS
jgi:hypothetical protein